MDRPAWAALACAGAFLVLTALVVSGVTQPVDTWVIHQLRPSQEWWGEVQNRYSPWMSRLRPQHMYILLAGCSVAVSLWRRSGWPMLFGAGLAATSAVLTLVPKFALQRPDPFGYVPTTGGSYPSGHVVALVVCLAGCLLMVWPRVGWWLWTPVVAAAALLSATLVIVAAHWPTDVVGGALLALAVVSASSRTALRQRACRPARAWRTTPS